LPAPEQTLEVWFTQTPAIGVTSKQGRYRPLLLDSLAQAPAGKICLSLTSRARFVQGDRNAVHKQDPP
jgi:hypothetical protein